jgi:hypothetical protein
LAAITLAVFQCPAFGDIPPHVFEVLKTTADSLIAANGFCICPICRTYNSSYGNTITTTT